ncbi:MAG TPA: fused MFS/spermidine synthase [Pirellulaceae bacterium]|nr:fused MFS/spermidine synthase [Pirellulaceae bacterium]
MAWLFGFTLFTSAALLFTVQPMFAKLVLPRLGGTPSVWNTCMVFFQAMLLFGYLYAHGSTRRLPGRRQLVFHGLMLSLPLLLLPLALPESLPWDAATAPTAWLLGALAVSVGLPFLMLSTTNPTLQVWFAASGHPRAKDPYFLYAASNAGSFLGLFGYPFLVEPMLGLSTQLKLWSVGYLVLIGLIGTCALAVWRRQRWSGWELPMLSSDETGTVSSPSALAPTVRRRAAWFGLALIPSSLMLGVTTFLTTDVASFPLLWVIPLGIYLATFIIAFAQKYRLSQMLVVRWTPLLVLPVVATQAFSAGLALHWSTYALNLGAFTALALLCHGRLADLRPGPKYLTEFYLWLSAGGVAGGIFNTLVAPHLFVSSAEYSLAIVCGCLALPASEKLSRQRIDRILDVVFPVLTGAACLAIGLALEFNPFPFAFVAALVVPCVFGLSFSRRPLRFGLAVAAIFGAGMICRSASEEVLFWERGFFGANRVVAERETDRHLLVHGTTYHGWQYQDERRDEPLSYYHRRGPLGRLFGSLESRHDLRVAAIGMGCGTVMAYHRPGWHFTFYEIDPIVVRIAENPELFSYLPSRRGAYDVVLGDARVELERAESGRYDVMVMDAFSSDMIPTHLLTREALATYRRHLAEEGIIAFHVSNRFLDLVPILDALAVDAGMHAVAMTDVAGASGEAEGRTTSIYVFLAERRETLDELASDERARRTDADATRRPWTDDRCNVLDAVRW